MGKAKSSRKKAGKPSDFPKRKNKLGKGKRLAENATTVSFKSRSIVVPSQLAHAGSRDQPTGKRKLGLEALLRQLNHFKSSVRSDALTGLRELFQDHPHLVLPSLAQLISPVLGKLIDSDPSVRHSLLTLLPTLLFRVSSHNIRPHFNSIVAHLSCGLTHIADKTRLDSLKCFKMLLDLYPCLLSSHTERLVPLLCGLLSQLKGSGSSGKGGGGGGKGKSGGGRREVGLAHDPHSKLSKMTSRLRVFSLLSQYMKTFLHHDSPCEGGDNETPMPLGGPPLVDIDQKQVLIEKNGEFVRVDSNFCNFSGLFPSVMPLQDHGLLIKQPLSSSSSSLSLEHSLSSVGGVHDAPFFKVSKFTDISRNLISLLFDCWSECGLLRDKGSIEIFQLRETIIHLLYLTLKLSTLTDSSDSPVRPNTSTFTTNQMKDESSECLGAVDFLVQNFSTEFSKRFLSTFPLPHSSSSSSDGQFLQYLLMNLQLSYVAVQFSKVGGASSDKGLLSVIKFFGSLGRVSTRGESVSSQLMSDCVSVLADTLPLMLEIISGRGQWVESPDSYRLLSGVRGFYESCHSRSAAKKCLILCFHDLLKTYNSDSQVFVKLLQPWLDSLPQLLVELGQSNSLSGQILYTLTSAAPHIPPSHLEQHLLTILGSGVLSEMSVLSQRRFVELLWHVPVLSACLLGVVSQWVWSAFGRGNNSSLVVAAYLVEIIHQWFMKRRECLGSVEEWASSYLIFMMSIVIGNGKNEGHDGQRIQIDDVAHYEDGVQLMESSVDVVEKLKLVQVVCECVRCTPFSGQVLDLLSPTLLTIMEAGSCVTVDVAVAVLHFIHRLSGTVDQSGIPPHLLLPLARLCYPLQWLSRQPLSSTRVGVATREACRQVTNELLGSSPLLMRQILDISSKSDNRRESGDSVYAIIKGIEAITTQSGTMQ